jgi:predicted nucleotidyltransferase
VAGSRIAWRGTVVAGRITQDDVGRHRHLSGAVRMIAQDRIRDVSDRIARQFGPDRIILFGSYAYGAPTEHSDVDLLVVLPFEGKPYRKSAEIAAAVHAGFPLDVIAQRPDDVYRRYRDRDPLIREAVDRGRVLYERHR